MPSPSLLLRIALLAYPRDFRDRYGPELAEAFERSGGTVRALADVVRTGLGERVAARGYRRGHSRLRVPATGASAFVRDFGYDVRHAVREFRRSPGTLAVLILTVGLGLGANVAIFSAAWGILGRPLPFDHAPDLVRIVQERPDFDEDLPGSRTLSFSVAELHDYAGSPALAEVAEYHGMNFTLLGPEGAMRVSAGVVSSNYFDFVGMEPLHGRLFDAGEDRAEAEPVIVLGHGFWQEAFGGDPGVVGTQMEMNGALHQVVGILPAIPQFPREHDLYLPFSVCPTRSSPDFIEGRARRMMTAYARLEAGWTLDEARTAVEDIALEMRRSHPELYDLDGGFTADLTPMGADLATPARPVMGALAGIALLLLVITCANAASVLLARASRRWASAAVRSALGASRGRIIRQHLTEGLLLAAAGTGLGWVVALLTREAVAGFAARFTTRAEQIRLDGDVLVFATAAGLLTALVMGLAPLAAARGAPTPSAPSARNTPTLRVRRWQRRLVVLQVAVAFVALTGSGLLLRSLLAADRTELGLPTESVFTARVALDDTRYDLDGADAFLDQVTEALRQLPSVQEVTRLPWAPLAEHHEHRNAFFLSASPTDDPVAAVGDLRVVDHTAFAVLGMELLEGRLLDEGDDRDAPRVAVVNETFRRRYMHDELSLGSTAVRCLPDGQCDDPIRIVGVVSDIRSNGSEAELIPEIYAHRPQTDWFLDVVAVRLEGDPTPIHDALLSIVSGLDPRVPLTRVGTLEDFRQESLASRRILTFLVGLGGLVATGLALAGVFGIAHLTASARMREMGLRQALGAAPLDILGLVLREGLRVVGLGLVLGGVAAWYALRGLVGLLWNVPAHDPLTLSATALLFLGVGALASILPALRAARQDVMRTLGVP